MRILQDLNTYISLKNEDGSVDNEMQFIYSEPGHGKTLSMENMIEEYHRAGFVVLILSDVKDEFEFGFAMFEPEKRYHLEFLRKIGKPIERKNVKLYHPFTFDIPTDTGLPEINFYGFSLKELKRSEWSLISETAFESDTIRLLLNTSNSINRNEGLYAFIHSMREKTRVTKEKGIARIDPHNFFLDVPLATAKSSTDITSYLLPFKKDYFLVPDNSPIKLNWKDILTDNKNYHFFTSYWIDDEKIKEFCILALFNSILRNKKYCKYPLLIVIPEIRRLVPFKPEGYKKYLAYGIKSNLSIMRNMGRGMSGLFDAQVWGDVDENVRNTSSFNLYGQISGASDLDKLSKALTFGKDMRNTLKNMPMRNTYVVQMYKGDDPFILWMPGHMHKEEGYNFFETYRKHVLKCECPERHKLVTYKALHDMMMEQFKKEEELYKEKVKKKIKEMEEEREAKKKSREESKDKSNTENKDKIIEVKNEALMTKMKSVYLMKLDNPNISWRKLGEKMELDYKTAKKYFERYEKIISGDQDKSNAEVQTIQEENKQPEITDNQIESSPDMEEEQL